MTKADNARCSLKIHTIVFLMEKQADRILQQQLELTFSQFLILSAISQNPGLSQSKIAHRRNLTNAAVSKQIDTLLRRSLIDRQRHPQSRREYILLLTRSGEKTVHQARQITDQVFEDIFGVLTGQQRQNFENSLTKLLGSFDSSPA